MKYIRHYFVKNRKIKAERWLKIGQFGMPLRLKDWF